MYFDEVLQPVENILEGTWASGAPPDEWSDFRLMKEMGWSWDQLAETPWYVRRFCCDFLGMINERQRLDNERASRG